MHAVFVYAWCAGRSMQTHWVEPHGQLLPAESAFVCMVPLQQPWAVYLPQMNKGQVVNELDRRCILTCLGPIKLEGYKRYSPE